MNWRWFMLIVTIVGCQNAALREEAERIAAERDSLVAEVLESAALINQINIELAEVPDTTMGMDVATEGGLSRAARQNEEALAKIRAAIQALGERESEIRQARERIRQLSATESRLATQLAAYQETIAELRESAERRQGEYEAIIAQQRSMITRLARGLDTARVVNEDLTRANENLADSVSTLVDAANVAYYAVGTKDELEERGIVVNEGSKFLFFGSKTLQPARDLDPADFTAIDLREVREIELPRPDKDYRILTRQNPAFLDVANPEGKLREAVRIMAPEDFWAPSRFLILVQN